MHSTRHQLACALLLLSVAIGEVAAQAPRQSTQPGQPAQQPQPAQPAQPVQPPQGQPLLVVPAPAAPAVPRLDPDLPMVELLPLLERVGRSSNKRFLADARLGSRIYLGGVEPNDVTYPVLLAILRANGLATFESEGYVNIVPDANIRFHAPIVQTDDASIPPDLYVTRVLTTVHIPTAYLVPILRPMMPQAAHLASSQTGNQLIVMDRYENVQRISEIVRTLDVPGAPPLQPLRN